MSTHRATAAAQIDAPKMDSYRAALADQIDHLPSVKQRAKSPVSRRGYRVLLVVTGPGGGATGDKTAAAAAARAKLVRGRRGGRSDQAA